jgi:hypothetical protein
MDQVHASIPTEIIQNYPVKVLECLVLPWEPQPGTFLHLKGQTYTVLERRHRYHLASGQYQLCKIVILVQEANVNSEMSLVGNGWIIGDAGCAYNAHSPVIRCAVNPSGPCQGCVSYEPRSVARLRSSETLES